MKLLRVNYLWLKDWKLLVTEKLEIYIKQKCRNSSTAVTAAGRQQCILDSCSISPSCREPRVIIVGAGMAGLSAANRLTQCGIRNFVVLEAKER